MNDCRGLLGLSRARRARRRAPGATRTSRLLPACTGAALAMALVGMVTAPSPASGSTKPATVPHLEAVAPAVKLPVGAKSLGAVASTSELTGAIALRLPNPQAVASFIDRASTPHAAAFGHYLAPGQFAKRFGPAAATVSLVEHQLTRDHLQVTGVTSNHLFVEFGGTAAAVEATFHTGLERVRLANGTLGRATTSRVELPGTIAAHVQAVVGLDQLVSESAVALRATGASGPHGSKATDLEKAAGNGGPNACAGALALQASGGALTDQQIASAYGVDPLYAAGDLASGQTIDVYELEPFTMSDIAQFDECYFGTDNTGNITVTQVDGGPGTGYGSGEAVLDIDDVSAVAPHAKIDVFEGPNMDAEWGPLDTWNRIAVADNARQVTSSWGVCEPGLQQGAPGIEQVENKIFEQMAAQGQTVFAAAGDDGSDACAYHASSPAAPDLSALDPADQPYVTSVGGTTILDPTDPPSETVWDNGTDGGAGGGGISSGWAQQPWQSAVAVPQTAATEPCSNDPSGTVADNYHVAGVATTLPSGTLCREEPDVSALADPQTGVTIVYAGAWYQYGGTSSATPLWAAMLAEINGSSACSGTPEGVGFVDPALYQIADSPTTYADAFNDVTSGNNDNLGIGADEAGYPFYSAGAGYDMATGLGSPRVTNATNTGLGEQLCAEAADAGATEPHVASLSQDSGPIAGGTPLAITGTNFGATKGAVYFGDVTATIGTWSNTSITLDAPAYSSPPATPAGAAGSADVTVVTSSGASSGLGPDAVFHYDATSGGRPVIDYIDTPGGPASGGSTLNAGNVVDVIGSGFTGATSVSFGGISATPVVLSDDELEVTPPSDAGASCLNGGVSATGVCAVAVAVTTPDGTSLTPGDGGVPILPAYSGPIVFNPNGSLTPACMTASTPTCEVVQAPEEYDYAAAPTVTSVTVQGGGGDASEFGGSIATITGTGFNLNTIEWCNVGPAGPNDNEDFSILSVSPTSLTVQLPADPATVGMPTVEPDPGVLTVQALSGISNTSAFTYAGIPIFGAITSPSPPFLAQATPGAVRVSGVGLSDVYEVATELTAPLNFLSSTSQDITSKTDTALTATVTSNFAFSSDLLLCTATGCSTPSSEVGSTADVLDIAYPGRPVVSSSTPSSGPAQGGTQVTIDGALDAEVLAVDFGTVPGTIVGEGSLTASAPIEVDAPPGTAGHTVDITIETVGGVLVGQPTSAVNPAATFSYEPSAPAAPGDVIASSGPGLVSVTWKAPSDDGGDPLTGYVVTAAASGKPTVTRTVPPTQTTTLFAGVAAVPWTVSVTPYNRLGAGVTGTAQGPVAPGSPPQQGYWIATATGRVYAAGFATPYGGTTASSPNPVVGIAAVPGGTGYWLATKDGDVTDKGSAPNVGELHSSVSDIVSIVATGDGQGFWLLGANGDVYPFGDAAFHGDLLDPGSGKTPVHLADVVGMEAAPSGSGYMLFTAKGTAYAFGTVHNYGIPASLHLTNVRGVVAAPLGTGYIVFTSTGAVYPYGSLKSLGSVPGLGVHVSDIASLVLTPAGGGYWIGGADGTTYPFGNAVLFGTPSTLSTQTVVGLAGT